MVSINPEVISRLSQSGYLQVPDWVIEAPADEFAKYRSFWLESFSGQCAVLVAQVNELLDNVRNELSGIKLKLFDWIRR